MLAGKVVGQPPEQEVMVTNLEEVLTEVLVEVPLVPFFGAAATEAAAAAKITTVENCIVGELVISERLVVCYKERKIK